MAIELRWLLTMVDHYDRTEGCVTQTPGRVLQWREKTDDYITGWQTAPVEIDPNLGEVVDG